MKEFSVSHKLTNEQISDVLCSALEGGSNYWCLLEEAIEPTSWEFASDPQSDQHWLSDYPLNPGGALLIGSLEDTEQHGTMRLDIETVQKGLAVLAEKYPRQIADILNENADADTGDALLQCCLFGDVIYS